MNTTTEDKILIAAEKEFLDKGYAKAKIATIAKDAGINHAMVHYYYGTKENLFDIVFKNKIDLLVNELEKSLDQGGDFFEQLERTINSHLNFLEANPKLLLFLLREVSTNSDLMQPLQSIIYPRVIKILERVRSSIATEVQKGTIKPIVAEDLLLNIVSLNGVSVLVMSLIGKINTYQSVDQGAFIEHRKKHIVELITNNIKV